MVRCFRNGLVTGFSPQLLKLATSQQPLLETPAAEMLLISMSKLLPALSLCLLRRSMVILLRERVLRWYATSTLGVATTATTVSPSRIRDKCNFETIDRGSSYWNNLVCTSRDLPALEAGDRLGPTRVAICVIRSSAQMGGPGRNSTVQIPLSSCTNPHALLHLFLRLAPEPQYHQEITAEARKGYTGYSVRNRANWLILS